MFSVDSALSRIEISIKILSNVLVNLIDEKLDEVAINLASL